MLVPHRYLRLIGAASAVSAAAHPNATNFSAGADFVRELKPKSSKHAKNSKKSSHDAKTSKKKKKTEKNKSACAKAIEGSWLYDCPLCECNQWLLTLSCEGDRCAYTEREHPTECGLAPQYSESWDYPCTLSGNAPAGVAGIEKGYMEFSSESISKGGGEDKIICELGSTTTPINLGNFGEHCTKEITESEHSYAVKAEFSSDEMHLYVSVDGGKLFTGLRYGNRFVEERLFDGPDGGRGLIHNPFTNEKHCPTCNDWIPCKRDKTKTDACLTNLVDIAKKGAHEMLKVMKGKHWSGLDSTQTTINLLSTLHPTLSTSFAIATWLFSEEEKPAKTTSLLTEINDEFKLIYARLHAIDNAINEVSFTMTTLCCQLGCDSYINTAIGELNAIKHYYDLAVNGDSNARNDFIKSECPVLDKSFHELIRILILIIDNTTGNTCIKQYYITPEYYSKTQKFYQEIVAPLVQWIVYALQMTAVCPNINKVSYEFQTRRATEVIEAIKKEWKDMAPDFKPEKVVDKCPVFTQDPTNDLEQQEKMLKATQPCGYYQSQGCKYPVIPANVVHPGEGPGELQYIPYIVQFDIGTHPNLKDRVAKSWIYQNRNNKRDFADFGGWSRDEGEKCLEIIVTGGSKATGGCAGKCGIGCELGGGYAKDCMKHDVCATWKAMYQKKDNVAFDQDDGFCIDADCGDEAASTIHNCFIDNTWPFNDTPMTCEKSNFEKEEHAYGHWSHSTKVFSEGPCNNFISWKNGQGIPDRNEIDNPY